MILDIFLDFHNIFFRKSKTCSRCTVMDQNYANSRVLQKKYKTFLKMMNSVLLCFLKSTIKQNNKRFPLVAAKYHPEEISIRIGEQKAVRIFIVIIMPVYFRKQRFIPKLIIVLEDNRPR